MNAPASAQILEVYRPIAALEPGKEHGNFLTIFAEAVVRADEENFEILRPAAVELIEKYELLGNAAGAGPRSQTPPRPPGRMTDERFNELLNGPLRHPFPIFTMSRLRLALRVVVEDTGEAGAWALERHCASRQEQDEMEGE